MKQDLSMSNGFCDPMKSTIPIDSPLHLSLTLLSHSIDFCCFFVARPILCLSNNPFHSAVVILLII